MSGGRSSTRPHGRRRASRGTTSERPASRGWPFEAVFGGIEIERATYQRAGRGRVAVPLELRLGIVEGAYTPRVARILTKAVAHRVPPAIASRYEGRREIIENAIRARDVIPEETVTIQVALDGVMVPQDGEHARARGRKTDEPDPPRHEQRYGQVGPKAPSATDGTLGRAWA